MTKKKALFVYVTPYLVAESTAELYRVSYSLKDLQAKGYLTVGLCLHLVDRLPKLKGLDVLHLVLSSKNWSFPEYAWSIARRHSLDLRQSLFCSSDPVHVEWANSAGLLRTEDPRYLLNV